MVDDDHDEESAISAAGDEVQAIQMPSDTSKAEVDPQMKLGIYLVYLHWTGLTSKMIDKLY